LCWPYRAEQKGSVENLVGFVKSSFFKVRRFHDEEDLRQQLQEWHREVNEERPCRATGIIPALRLAEEAPRLRALKVQPPGSANPGLCRSHGDGTARRVRIVAGGQLFTASSALSSLPSARPS
jgi:hypothetical protein